MNTIKRMLFSFFLLLVWGGMSTYAQSRLTPISAVTYWDRDGLSDYPVELKRLLLPSSYRFAYIVAPSFRTEYSLVCKDDSTLILRKAEQRISLAVNQNTIETISFDIETGEIKTKESSSVKDTIETPINVPIKEFQLHVSPTILESIDKLFTSAVVTSSYLCMPDGCDGTTYIFISGRFTAKCWSPGEGSNCRKLVNLADSIVKAVELHDSMMINNNLNNIIELGQTFEDLYKKKHSFIDYLFSSDNHNGTYTHFRGEHFVAFLCITIIIFILIGIVGLIILLCNQKTKKCWWIPLLSAILISTVIILIAYLYLKLNAISW